MVVPSLCRLRDILNVAVYPKALEFVAEQLHDDLEKRSDQYLTNSLVLAATFLDRRFKKFKFVKYLVI